MSKFRKKPVVIEAVQWTGENFDELFDWGSPNGGIGNAEWCFWDDKTRTV